MIKPRISFPPSDGKGHAQHQRLGHKQEPGDAASLGPVPPPVPSTLLHQASGAQKSLHTLFLEGQSATGNQVPTMCQTHILGG